MTEDQKQAYAGLLEVVEEDVLFFAYMADQISKHVSSVKGKMQKIKDLLDKQQPEKGGENEPTN
jgi:hypothetical protein